MVKLIAVTDGTTHYYINPSNISYIESQADFNYIYFTGKKDPLKVSNSLVLLKKYIEFFEEASAAG